MRGFEIILIDEFDRPVCWALGLTFLETILGIFNALELFFGMYVLDLFWGPNYLSP